MADENKVKADLTDIAVGEVSLVGSPAIDEMFVLIKSVSGAPDLPLAEADHAWDSGAARRRVVDWATSGTGDETTVDWARVHRAFFWYDANKADTITGHKLGFADVIDGELRAVPRGIYAVAAVLQGARGGVGIPESDIPAIKGKVEAYYNRLGTTAPWAVRKEEDPPMSTTNDAPETDVNKDAAQAPAAAAPQAPEAAPAATPAPAEGAVSKDDGPGGDSPLEEAVDTATPGGAVQAAATNAPVQAALIAENLAILTRLAGELAQGAATMPLDEIRARIWGMRDTFWRIEGLSEVAVLAKSVDAALAAGNIGEALIKVAETVAVLKAQAAPAAEAAPAAAPVEEAPVVKDGEGGTTHPRKFTKARIDIVKNAIAALVGVLKDVGAADLDGLFAVAKSETDPIEAPGAAEVVKALEEGGIQATTEIVAKSADVAALTAARDEAVSKAAAAEAQVEILTKRVQAFENAGTPRTTPGAENGAAATTPVAKSAQGATPPGFWAGAIVPPGGAS